MIVFMAAGSRQAKTKIILAGISKKIKATKKAGQYSQY